MQFHGLPCEVVNQLNYGDDLQVLRDHIAKESVDLIYLDAPKFLVFVGCSFADYLHSAQQESFVGSLKREMATIFSASAIVG